MGIYFDLFKDQWEKSQDSSFVGDDTEHYCQNNIMNVNAMKDKSISAQRETLGYAVELLDIAYQEYNKGNEDDAIDILTIVQTLGEAIECQILLNLVQMAMEAMSK